MVVSPLAPVPPLSPALASLTVRESQRGELLVTDVASRFLAFRPNAECYSIGLCPLAQDVEVRRFMLALALALTHTLHSRVLAVALPGSHKGLDRFCGVPASPGLQEMLQTPPQNRFDTIHQTRFPFLSLLPAGGDHLPLPSDQVASRMNWLHELVRPHFETVITLYPALSTIRRLDATYGLPDATFALVKRGMSAARVREAVCRLEDAGAQVAGSILCNRAA